HTTERNDRPRLRLQRLDLIGARTGIAPVPYLRSACGLPATVVAALSSSRNMPHATAAAAPNFGNDRVTAAAARSPAARCSGCEPCVLLLAIAWPRAERRS